MENLSFEQLRDIYLATDFSPDGDHSIRISSVAIRDALLLIENDEAASRDAQIFVAEDDLGNIQVGRNVKAEMRSPKVSLGFLVRTLDDLLNVPDARLVEPAAYFIIEGKVSRWPTPAPIIRDYRNVLSLVMSITEAASYVDSLRQEIVFIRDGKIVLPINYTKNDISNVNRLEIEKYLKFLTDDAHREPKLQIIREAVIQLTKAHPPEERISFILRNIDVLNEIVIKEYRIYASTFTYAKIREDLESSRIDYIGKIHKTFIDIQGQLLGVPVAAFVVASQLKAVASCSVTLVSNVALVGGAWIFVTFLMFGIVNQWMTLSSINIEIRRQREKLEYNYAEISTRFIDIFDGLQRRIILHYIGLVSVSSIAVISAIFATFAFHRLVSAELGACLLGPGPIAE